MRRAPSSAELQLQAAELAEREVQARRDSWEQQFRSLRAEVAERDRRIVVLEHRVAQAELREAQRSADEARWEQQRHELASLRRQLNDLAALALRLRAAEGEKLEAERKLAITQKELLAVQGVVGTDADAHDANRPDSVGAG